MVTVGYDRDGPWVSVGSIAQMKEVAMVQSSGEDELLKGFFLMFMKLTSLVAIRDTTGFQAAGVGKGFVRLFDITTARPCGKVQQFCLNLDVSVFLSVAH